MAKPEPGALFPKIPKNRAMVIFAGMDTIDTQFKFQVRYLNNFGRLVFKRIKSIR